MASRGSTHDELTQKGRAFLAEMQALKSKPFVKIGVLQQEFLTPKEEKAFGQWDVDELVTLGMVAVANEFGTPPPHGGVGKHGPVRGIPERSFIRSTADEKKQTWREYSEKLRKEVVEGRMSTEKALGLMGTLIKKDIQTKIRSNIPPANAPATIAAKGSEKTLINTGQLLNSIDYEVHREAEK